MTSLIAAALFFVGIHVLISGTVVRDRLVARMGERPYQGLFSALSALGLGWLIWAYVSAHEPVVTPLVQYRFIGGALILIAFVLIAFGVLGRSATLIGGESLLNSADPARGMHRITRHPMLWGFALWAATHMVFNPEPPSLVFFGVFLTLGLIGPLSIDAKRARQFGEKWQAYLDKTSNFPFAAIVQGRNRLIWSELSLAKLAVALAAYIAFAALHARLFRMPPF